MNHNFWLIAFLLNPMSIMTTSEQRTISQSRARLQPQGALLVARLHEARKQMGDPPMREAQLQPGMANVARQKVVMRIRQNLDPNLGYELYWKNGSRLIPTTPGNGPEYPCGVKCRPMYKMYGKICARNKHFEYKMFDNYCAMQADDCTGLDDWSVAHTGNCNMYTGFHNFTKFIDRKPIPLGFTNLLDVNYYYN